MSTIKEEENTLQPHHEQLPLCTTRQPYRQGRKLTAVKVYTVNAESNHLLVFGVPSLNLRREAKDLFIRFGTLVQFSVTTDHPAEQFTETYHACYQRIQSARIAKKMLDTKNFYGGSLHVCYAPEFETIQETRTKLMQRKKDILFRLRNIQKESTIKPSNTDSSNSNVNNEVDNSNVNTKDPISDIVNEVPNYNLNMNHEKKLNMGENNLIYVNKSNRKVKKKDGTAKRFKSSDTKDKSESNEESLITNSPDIVDCTSVDKQVISNINDALNYNKFGNEVIKNVHLKPMNKIVFNFNKKT